MSALKCLLIGVGLGFALSATVMLGRLATAAERIANQITWANCVTAAEHGVVCEARK